MGIFPHRWAPYIRQTVQVVGERLSRRIRLRRDVVFVDFSRRTKLVADCHEPRIEPKVEQYRRRWSYPVRLLGVDLDGKIYHTSYSGSGDWTKWSAFVSPTQKISFVAITPSLHYEAFAVAADGTLFHNYNDGSWHDWGVHGVTTPFPTSVFQVGGFINNVAGHLEVFTFNGDDQISHTWQDNYYTWQSWEHMFFDGSAELRSQ